MRQFPQELVDEVLCYLHDDKPALSSTSLVCKSWTRTAREQLFRTIHLTFDSMPKRAHAVYPYVEIPDWCTFVSAFQSFPTLASHVEELRTQGIEMMWDKEEADYQPEVGQEYDDSDDEEYDPPMDSVDNVSHRKLTYVSLALDTLRDMADAVPRLQRLILRDIMLVPAAAPFSPNVTRLEALSLERVGTRRDLHVLAVLHMFSPEKIRFDGAFGWSVTAAGEPVGPYDYSGLTTCKDWYIRGEPQSAYLLRTLNECHRFLATVESLHLHVRDLFEIQELHSLLGKTGRNLRTLRLHLQDMCVVDSMQVFFARESERRRLFYAAAYLTRSMSLAGLEVFLRRLDLSACASIKSFELALVIGTGWFAQETVRLVTRLLGTLPPSTREVTLVLDFAFFGPLILDVVWAELDETLSGLRALRGVTMVVLHDGAPVSDEAKGFLADELFPSRFPRIRHMLRPCFDV